MLSPPLFDQSSTPTPSFVSRLLLDPPSVAVVAATAGCLVHSIDSPNVSNTWHFELMDKEENLAIFGYSTQSLSRYCKGEQIGESEFPRVVNQV
jgi:hypothetical protein